jgi:hypothetical protein
MLTQSNREPSRHVAYRNMPLSSMPRHKRLSIGVLLVGALATIGFVNAKTVGQAVQHIEPEKPAPSGVPVVSRPCGEAR